MMSLEFDYMCQYDYVEVRDGDNSNGQIIKRFCGNERPAPIRSAGSSLHILFHSDGSKNFDGFHAVFEEITGKGQGDTRRVLWVGCTQTPPFCVSLPTPCSALFRPGVLGSQKSPNIEQEEERNGEVYFRNVHGNQN